jgi:hypothetical protein
LDPHKRVYSIQETEMPSFFYYQPGPAGSGKTYQLAHWAVERAAAGEKVMIAQPTKELMRETARTIARIDGDTPVTQMWSRSRSDRVVSRILDHMTAAKPMAGEIMLVTHEALKRIPSNLRQFWHMVCDEVPSVLEHIDLKVAKTHQHVTAHIDASETLAPGLILLKAGDRTALEEVAVNATQDQNIASFDRLANTILSGEYLVVVNEDSYRDLIENPGTRGRIDVFAVRLPTFVHGYKTTTFMGANIEQTELFVIWSAICDVTWRLHPGMGDKLRYTTHMNGQRLTIGYLFEGKLSRYFLGQEDDAGETVLDRVADFIALYWASVPFLWQANKDTTPAGFDHGGRLPGVSHGLDKAAWKQVHNVALLAAMNRKSAAYGFLEKIGVTAEQAQATLSWQNDYQAMMRCSLRDPDAIAPVRVIVGSKAGAEWIAERFPGAVLEKVDHGIEEPRRGGRPEGSITGRAKSSAERVREHRARKKAERGL